jgi:hypothetical protein
MPPAGAGRGPCRHRTEQQCGRKRECQDDGAPTRLRQRSLRCCHAIVNRRSESVGDRPVMVPTMNEIGPVVGVHTVMTGRGEKDPTGFCSLLTALRQHQQIPVLPSLS